MTQTLSRAPFYAIYMGSLPISIIQADPALELEVKARASGCRYSFSWLVPLPRARDAGEAREAQADRDAIDAITCSKKISTSTI